jgi:hypothetical protein
MSIAFANVKKLTKRQVLSDLVIGLSVIAGSASLGADFTHAGLVSLGHDWPIVVTIAGLVLARLQPALSDKASTDHAARLASNSPTGS